MKTFIEYVNQIENNKSITNSPYDYNHEFKKWTVFLEKRDACYHKVKSRYHVWPSAYACVPVKTSKALTREGWKHYNELTIGEEILTYSMQNDCLEFNTIKNLHHYDNAKTYVIKNGNTGWKFECTPNHRWVVKHTKTISNRKRKYTNLINDMRLVTTEELLNGSGSNRKLVISSKYYGGNPIEMEKIYKYQTNWLEYLINCTPEQRQSWLYSAIIYDGNQIRTQRLVEQTNQSNHEYQFDTPYGKQSFGFKQKDINHRDAFLLSAFMNKGLVTFKRSKNADIYSCHYTAYNGTKSWEGFKLIDEREAEVWCPETENGTWIMMQETDGNGVISITGNSGALVKCRKVGARNWGNSRKNETTELNEDIFKAEKEKGLRGWFDRNKGKGWIDCKASKKGKLVPCGRKKAGKGTERKYPACRPTLSACNKTGVKKKRNSKAISWKKKILEMITSKIETIE